MKIILVCHNAVFEKYWNGVNVEKMSFSALIVNISSETLILSWKYTFNISSTF